jgi:hypothetical protein
MSKKKLEAASVAASEARKFDVKAVLAKYRPAPTFEILLPDGFAISCRAFERLSDRKEYEQRFVHWYTRLPKKGTQEAAIHPLRDVFPRSVEEAAAAHLLHTVAVEPPIPLADALAINSCPELMMFLQQQIDIGLGSVLGEIQRNLIEAAGNESSATTDTESC